MQLHLTSGAQTYRNVTSHKQSKPLARFIGYNLLRYKYCCGHAWNHLLVFYRLECEPQRSPLPSIEARRPKSG